MRLFESKSFRRFISSYIIVLILPFLFSVLIYNVAIKNMQDQAIRFSYNNLNNIRDKMQKEIVYADQYILNLSTSPELKRIINLPPPSEGAPERYWFYEFHNSYNNSLVASEISDKLFLFINTNETVVYKNYMSHNYRDFYKDFFTYEGVDYDQWVDMYFNRSYFREFIPARNIVINGTEGNYITALYSLPIVSDKNTQESQGVIAYLFDADEIKRMLMDTISEDGGWAYIVDDKGQLLVTTDTSKQNEGLDMDEITEGYVTMDINGEEMIVIKTSLPDGSWNFISVIPSSSIKSHLNPFRFMALGAVIILFLIGITISFLLSYKNTKPIHALLNLFPGLLSEKNINHKNELLYIEDQVKNLITDNNKMGESILRQYNYLQILYFEKLLKGNLEDDKDLELAKKYVDIDLKDSSFVVMLIRINSMDNIINKEILYEQDLFRAFLNKELIGASKKKAYVHILNQNELALLHLFDINNAYEEELNKLINTVSNVFEENFTIKPIFAVGNTYNNLFNAHFSLKEARCAADSLMEIDRHAVNNVIWYKDFKHDYNGYFYINEIEQRIINLTKLGKWNELNNYLNKIYLNSINDMIGKMKWIFINDLCATLVKLSSELKIDIDLELIEKNINTRDYDQYFKVLKSEYKKVCCKLMKEKKSHNEKLKIEILSYIDERFTDSSLSVAQLSVKFNLSQSYFSQFFKEQTSETFSHYLEKLRIDYACNLLLNSNQIVDEIALQSGYSNTNTFRRAFRRVTGLSPTGYIKANKDS